MATRQVPAHDASSNFFIPPTQGQSLATDILQKTGGEPVKVAEAIIETICHPSIIFEIKAGFLRFFSAPQLQALKEKVIGLRSPQNTEFFTEVFNAAIHSSNDAATRENLLAVKNVFLSTDTSALGSPISYPVALRFPKNTEVGQYFGEVVSEGQKKKSQI